MFKDPSLHTNMYLQTLSHMEQKKVLVKSFECFELGSQLSSSRLGVRNLERVIPLKLDSQQRYTPPPKKNGGGMLMPTSFTSLSIVSV